MPIPNHIPSPLTCRLNCMVELQHLHFTRSLANSKPCPLYKVQIFPQDFLIRTAGVRGSKPSPVAVSYWCLPISLKLSPRSSDQKSSFRVPFSSNSVRSGRAHTNTLQIFKLQTDARCKKSTCHDGITSQPPASADLVDTSHPDNNIILDLNTRYQLFQKSPIDFSFIKNEKPPPHHKNTPFSFKLCISSLLNISPQIALIKTL